MHLHSDYRLELKHFDFPYADNAPPQICSAFFMGDFAITFRPFFFGPSTVVPFRDGRIVPDRSQWHIDNQTLEGVVSSVVRHRETHKPLGLRVDIWLLAFAPKALLPQEWHDRLDEMVGRSVLCTVNHIDDQQGTIMVEIQGLSSN